MNGQDLVSLAPMIVLAAASLVVLLVIAVFRNYRAAAGFTLSGFVLAFAALPLAYANAPRQVTPLLVVDGSAVFYTGLLLATGFAVALLSYGYVERLEGNREEYWVLLILATLGAIVLVASNHFASFFLGLEILSVSLYALISYQRYHRERVEAGVKYLILAGATSAFLLFGMALIYAVQGSMAFAGTTPALTGEGVEGILLAGWGLLLVGIGFKLALVPFHLWTPDVYQGAPAPVTGFIASVSKGGVFALLVRYFSPTTLRENETLWLLFAGISIASMLYGNLVALMQNNVKRILAYSSIAHLGYLLVAFLASDALGLQAVAFYLVAYFLTTLAAFGVITVMSYRGDELCDLEDYRGLFWRDPLLAVIFTAALLSLAGIPPTAGLVGKIYIAAAGVEAALWVLLITLVIGSVIGVFYYLRIVIAMYRRPDVEPVPEGVVEPERPLQAPSFSLPGGVALALLTFLLVGLGVYPGPLFQLIESLVLSVNGP